MYQNNRLLRIYITYLFPIVLLASYGYFVPGVHILGLGLIISAIGTLVLYKKTPVKIAPAKPVTIEKIIEVPAPQNLEHIQTLEREIEQIKQETEQVQKDREHFRKLTERLQQELDLMSLSTQKEGQSKEILLTECQNTIAEQRAMIQKKQQQILRLEGKIRDLNYDVKTLLQLNDFEEKEEPLPSLPDYLPEEMLSHDSLSVIKRGLQIAKSITGAIRWEDSAAPENHVLDLKRLQDRLSNELDDAVFVYSPQENKLISINPAVYPLLGWNQDKFMQSFPEIIQESWPQWKKSLEELSFKDETTLQIHLRSKSGQSKPFQCQLCLIPTGIFRNHILGAFLPS